MYRSRGLQQQALCTPTEALKRAKEVEGSIYDTAQSLQEYHERCSAVKTTDDNARPPEEAFFDGENAAALSPTAITIAHYEHAVHYRDGLFSEVYKAPFPRMLVKAHLATGDFVALKVTTPSMMHPPHDSEKEARVLHAVSQSDRITPLLEAFRYAGSRYVLALPFLPYSLDSLLATRHLSESQAKAHLRDMFSALSYLHKHEIIHRDVKPSNILLRSPTGPAFLSDFGIAWCATDFASEKPSEKITDVGTSCYRPPEILFGKKSYDCTLDLWAAGCVVAEAASLSSATLFEPGEIGTELALIQSIFMNLGTPNEVMWPSAHECPDWGKMQWKIFPPRSWSELLPRASSSARDLTGKLVRYEHNERISADAALAHPYLAIDN